MRTLSMEIDYIREARPRRVRPNTYGRGQKMVGANLSMWGRIAAGAMGMTLGFCELASAQASPPQPAAPTTCQGTGFLPAPATWKAVEQLPDNRVTFRVCAPGASAVSVTSSDVADVIPMGIGGGPNGLAMTKDDKGLWSVTTPAPIAPDTYRFNFSVDGVPVPNPQGNTFSEARVGTNGTFEVLGAAGAFQTYNKDIPHGSVAVVEYWSSSLGVKRRAHVYTPPGYARGGGKYPVLYLVHGAGDSDDSWTSVGHAHYILDNLIAAGKAKPMIVVMPFGHTPDRPGTNMLTNTDFADDFLKDLIPYVEANYRAIKAPASRAMAGLSMGGAHTLNNGITHPELFAYVGIFSMGMQNPQQIADYDAKNGAALDRAGKSMRLVYYAVGKADFLYPAIAPTRALFAKHGIKDVYNESEGGHTWINWRRYFNDFAPRLFR
jgi:enterochelin esterase-like enzyme